MITDFSEISGIEMFESRPHTLTTDLQEGVVIVKKGDEANGDREVQEAAGANRLCSVVGPRGVRVPARRSKVSDRLRENSLILAPF